MDPGLVMNAAVVVICVGIGAVGLWQYESPRRREALALATCAFVVAAWPLAVTLEQRLAAGTGSADASRSWSWVLLACTALVSGAAVHLVLRSSRRAHAHRVGPLPVLDSLVVAKMALELDQPVVAAQALQRAITTVRSDLAESQSEERGTAPEKEMSS